MKELSIFVDESGDFGVYDYHAPFYIISMVLHDQAVNIVDDLKILENELSNIGWSKHSVHSGPVIRSEEEYRGYDLKERQKIIMKMMSFVRRLNINFKSIYIEKKHIEDSIEATGKLSKQLAVFIRDNYAFFCNYDTVKIYYDNGQVEVTRILSSVATWVPMAGSDISVSISETRASSLAICSSHFFRSFSFLRSLACSSFWAFQSNLTSDSATLAATVLSASALCGTLASIAAITVSCFSR